MNSLDLHNIRQVYSKQTLNEEDCDSNPLIQFENWLNAAIEAKVNEPTAMNIATVDEFGHPNARIVLLKEINDEGFIFFSNYLSRKGQALSLHSFAALTFFWPELERQIRIEGNANQLTAKESDTYFYSRPYTSRIGAWASHQSEIISSKKELLTRAALISAKHPIKVPRPPYWGGYIIKPNLIEFWQGRPSRLHDRIQYRLVNEIWIKERLAP